MSLFSSEVGYLFVITQNNSAEKFIVVLNCVLENSTFQHMYRKVL